MISLCVNEWGRGSTRSPFRKRTGRRWGPPETSLHSPTRLAQGKRRAELTVQGTLSVGVEAGTSTRHRHAGGRKIPCMPPFLYDRPALHHRRDAPCPLCVPSTARMCVDSPEGSSSFLKGLPPHSGGSFAFRDINAAAAERARASAPCSARTHPARPTCRPPSSRAAVSR
jgi:hypothetical protein